MSLLADMQPREEDLYYETDAFVDDDQSGAALDAMHRARHLVSLIEPSEATIEADAALYDAICAFGRAA